MGKVEGWAVGEEGKTVGEEKEIRKEEVGKYGAGGESGIGINGCAGRWRIENHEWKKY